MVKPAKQIILEAVPRLPKETSFQDMAKAIAFLAALHQGSEDIDAGRMVSKEEMKRRVNSWVANQA